MQRKQHTLLTIWNEQSSLPICHSYVPAGSSFTAIAFMNNSDKKRPWFER